MANPIEYIPDTGIDAAMDAEIRGLLTTCFTKPHDAVFQTRRYFNEPYPHRWIIRDERGALAAHIGVHEKEARVADGTVFRFGGIAEVCVRPDCRGRGYVREILAVIHEKLTKSGFPFSVLFGRFDVYSSSGYLPVSNVLCRTAKDEQPKRMDWCLVKPLAGNQWPQGDVILQGLVF